MKCYIGIDLGTTNSAICTYDGENIRIWKSPEQNDVTPSAIFLDRRGNKYLGQRAYDNAARNPDNAATLFKRFMGTSTPIKFSAVDLVKTPEECSAEILKTLYGYLPEEIRREPETGTVITVPAAFNQMQKDATLKAAHMAGIGNVALMQEPVAALMSVMQRRRGNGKFLIYDLGGGTFDIALAESTGGRVDLLAHGGIAMCGGRNMDRLLWENKVRPWLLERFDLPVDFSVSEEYRPLIRLGLWAVERAKIELSSREESMVTLSEAEIRMRDLGGDEVYLEVELTRSDLDELIEKQIDDTIQETRTLLEKSGVGATDLDCVVFVGGPTNYKPLRDKVAFELGVEANIDVNPMTAVAEGASIFAEAVDWSSQKHERKSSRGRVESGGSLPLTFEYISRTPDSKAKIAAKLASSQGDGWEFQIDSPDTGWTSGRMALRHGTIVNVVLPKSGENRFNVFVFDPQGSPVSLKESNIVIVRTAGTVESITASHSLGLEVLEKLGGESQLFFLVKAGDSLPAKGRKKLKAGEALKAGSPNSLNFKLWEGDIKDRIHDNRFVGCLKIDGISFDDGVIPAGADLEFDYEVLDSGTISVGVEIPCVCASFKKETFNVYDSREGQRDYTESSPAIVKEAERELGELDAIAEKISESGVDDARIERTREKLEVAAGLDPDENDPERAKEADERILEARKLLAEMRQDHQKVFRQMELDKAVAFFVTNLEEHAKPSEATNFKNLTKTAQRAIDTNDASFNGYLKNLERINFEILWRQPWFLIDHFKYLAASPHLFTDKQHFEELCEGGMRSIREDNMDCLKETILSLYTIIKQSANVDDMYDAVNIIRG